MLIGQKDLGSSLLFFTLFVVMLWVATERASLPGHRRACCSPAAPYARLDSCSATCRTGSTSGSTRGPTSNGQGLPDRPGASSPSPGAGSPARASAWATPSRIPAVQTDFIFAAIGEELGLVGATAILIAYLLMIGAGLRIAQPRRAPVRASCWPTGLTTIIGVQAFIIIAGVTRVLPLTGVTLPFVSYGGSSLRGQLRPARPPAAHLRRHRAAPRRGAPQAHDATLPAQARPGRGGRVNKQIRRLARRAARLLHGAVRAAQPAAGRARPTTTTADPDNTREIVRDFSQPARPDPHRRRRRPRRQRAVGRPLRATSAGTRRATCSASVDRLLLVHSTAPTASSGSTTTCWPAAPPSQQLQGLADLFVDERPNVGDVTLTLRADLQAVAQQALGDREGSVVALDPRTGAILAMYSQPELRPEPAGQPRLRRGRGGPRRRCWRDPAKPLLANAVPGALPAGLDVQGDHRHGRPRQRHRHAARPSTRRTSEYLPPGTTDPIENFGGTVVRRRPPRDLPAQSATPPSPRWASTSAPRAWCARPRPSASTTRRRSTCPGRRRARSRRSRTSASTSPSWPRSSFGQNDGQLTPLQMALVAGGGGQRRRDDGAPRAGARCATSDGNVVDSATSPSRGRRR